MNIKKMTLTNNSKLLMDHFSTDGANLRLPQENDVDPMFLRLYDDLKNGFIYVLNSSKSPIIKQQEILNVSQIPYPKIFPASSFPTEIREHINETSEYYSSFKIKEFGRTITIYFISELSNYLELSLIHI